MHCTWEMRADNRHVKVFWPHHGDRHEEYDDDATQNHHAQNGDGYQSQDKVRDKLVVDHQELRVSEEQEEERIS